MRRGWREVLLVSMVFLLGAAARGAQPENGKANGSPEDLLGITIELSWTAVARQPMAGEGAGEAPAVMLSVSQGRVADVIAWPASDARTRPLPRRQDADGAWKLGSESGGRVRARIEVGLGADLVVRRGDQAVRVPVAAILEKPHHTPSQAPLTVSVERLPWDSLIVDAGPAAEGGVAAPSASVPVSVSYNILWPDAAEVTVRSTATLRPMSGSEPIWRFEQREQVQANQHEPSARVWNVPMPAAEGTYVLEIRAAWEPTGVRDGTRLGRLIRRRKTPPLVNSATRRVVLAVVDPREGVHAPASTPGGAEGHGRETDVDTIDMGRIRGSRFTAWGRSPTLGGGTAWLVPDEVVTEAGKRERERDRLRSLIGHSVSEAGNLGPADDSGLSWSAVGLKAAHPDRPHRLSVTITGGDPSALGVALVGSGAGGRPRILLDACASGPPILNQGPQATFSWLVWPDADEPVVLLLNRKSSASIRVGTVRLTELDDLPLPPPARLPGTPSTRSLGLYLATAGALDRFGGAGETGLNDALEAARNLVNYLTLCGASLVVLPEALTERQMRRALKGQADEDSIGPDRLDLSLRLIRRQGYAGWLELGLEGRDALPGLPPPDSVEALRHGLVRVDRQGLADGPAYHPLHPDVRQAMKRRVESVLKAHAGAAGCSGLLVQLGPGPTLLGTPDTGMDDETFTRFVQETFGPETAAGVPGLGTTEPNRFAERSKYLAGVGRMPWLTWRSRAIAALYTELAEAARAASPGSTLALATPVLHSGAASAEARRVDLAGLAPSQAWRSVGLDLQAWPTDPNAPILLRGVEISEDPLAHDLATSPDLDARIAARPRRGSFLRIGADPADAEPGLGTANRGGEVSGEAGADGAGGHDRGSLRRPAPARTDLAQRDDGLILRTLPLGDGAAADEPLEHALAALDAQWVILAAPAIAGHEERLRRFSTVLRSLPAWPAQSSEPAEERRDFGVAVRSMSDATQSFLEIANDTPYPIRLSGTLDAPVGATVEDLGRNLRLVPQAVAGGHQLVLDLLPFGVSAIRVGAPNVHLTGLTPYPSEAVLTTMEARFQELSNQLARLNRGAGNGAGEPANPGFEQEAAPNVRQAQNSAEAPVPSAAAVPVPGGWRLEGGMGSTMAVDQAGPHSGRGSLRLSTATVPATVVSGEFVPGSSSSMLIQAFFRAEPADSRVRLWIQGETGGEPYLRRSEFSVPSEWDGKAVRASDLPAGGLDSARLRFEMITPGTLWIDDVKVVGEAPPRAVRLNAQRTLLAALQAYRTQRYAEFARLSGSHWARHPSVLAVSRTARPTELSGVPAPPRSGPSAASALSPDRRLR
jgi:hypothetical protein